MSEILVTGSQGYLGKPLVKQFIRMGLNVHEFDISYGQDVCSKDDLNQALNGIDIVLNLAAMGDLYDVMDDPERGFQANVTSARILGEACREKGIELIHVSTCCVYGDQCGLKSITEGAIPKPTEIYAEQKLQAENILMEESRKGLQLCIARLGTIYGGEMRPSQVMYRFIFQNLRKEPIVFHGSGQQERAYTHIDDVISGLYILVTRKKRDIIYNVSSENAYSVAQLANSIAQITGNPFRIINVDDRPGQFMVQPMSAERMRAEFGWNAETSLQIGLQSSIEHAGTIIVKENYNHSLVPCFHRIHIPEGPVEPGHKIQIRLGFSMELNAFKTYVLDLARNLSGDERMLVTFDDGYRDVLLLEDFFSENSNLQPVVFYPTCLFDGKPLWFDVLYSSLASMEPKELIDICQNYGLDASNHPDVSIASSNIKKELRNIPPNVQDAELNKLIRNPIEPDFKRNYLGKVDLRRLIKKGWYIGSHSKYHYNLTKGKTTDVRKELDESLKSILEIGGRAWLAYPDGHWNHEIRNLVLHLGFTELFTLKKTSEIQNDPLHYYRNIVLL